MNSVSKNSYGFSALEAIAIIVVLIIVGAIGWFIYSNNQTNKKDTNYDAANIAPAGSNPTNDWQTQCLTADGLCLKYPATWTPGLVSNSGFTIESPNTTSYVQVQLLGENSYYHENFYVSSQTYTYSEGTKYKVFGGYTVGEKNDIPYYAVVVSAFGYPTAMKVGVISSIIGPTFIYLHDNNAVDVSVKLLPQNGIPINATPQESTSWLNSPTSQTGLEILKSITIN